MEIVKRTTNGGLVRWDPFREMREMERSFSGTIGELFDGRTFPALWGETGEKGTWTPSIEVLEKGDRYLVRAELPGLKKEEIDVSVLENTLTVSGERKEEKETKKEDYLYREHYYGSFHRTVPLPEGIDTGKIEATYENGILEVSVPKGGETRVKKVKVVEKGGEK